MAPLEIVHREAPCTNVLLTFTLERITQCPAMSRSLLNR